MSAKQFAVGFALLTSALSTFADWSLHEQFDRVLVYDGQFLREYAYKPRDIRGPHSGMFIWAVSPLKDGKLKPYAKGMEIKGELRAGQLLVSGESALNPTVVEFVVSGGSRLELEFGLCDLALAKGNKGTLLKIEMLAGVQSSAEKVTIEENRWQKKTVTLPKAERVLVRLIAARRGGGTNWTGLVVRGDGEVGTREQARALSPKRDSIGKMDERLKALAASRHGKAGLRHPFLSRQTVPELRDQGQSRRLRGDARETRLQHVLCGGDGLWPLLAGGRAGRDRAEGLRHSSRPAAQSAA